MKESVKKIDIRSIFPYLGLAAVIIIFQVITGGNVFTARNLKAILNDSFVILIGAVAFTFVMAAGNLDLSMGTVMAVACTCAAVASRISPWLALPAAVLSGMILGTCNGFVHVTMGLSSLIGTMTVQSIASGILILLLDGGTISAPFSMLKWNTMTLKIITMLLVAVIGAILFNFAPYGKYCKAIGSNANAAKLSGVSVGRIKYITFIVLGGVVGLLGFFSLIRTGSASAATGSELMMNVWCAVFLGGLPLSGGFSSRFRAPIIGSLTMAFLSNGMTLMGLGMYDKQLIKGVIFLFAIAISFERKNLATIK